VVVVVGAMQYFKYNNVKLHWPASVLCHWLHTLSLSCMYATDLLTMAWR